MSKIATFLASFHKLSVDDEGEATLQIRIDASAIEEQKKILDIPKKNILKITIEKLDGNNLYEENPGVKVNIIDDK